MTLTAAPLLDTRRLHLRMPVLADFEPFRAFMETDRSVHMGGPMNGRAAWRLWASEVALWSLRGYGPFTVADRVTGGYLGEVGFYHPVHFPEREIGWFVTVEAEGRGIAAEAARRVLDFARDNLGVESLVSYIAPENARSIALGLRLGGTRDPAAAVVDPGDVVIRYDLRVAA